MICDLISHLPIIAPYTDWTWLSTPSPQLNITALFFASLSSHKYITTLNIYFFSVLLSSNHAESLTLPCPLFQMQVMTRIRWYSILTKRSRSVRTKQGNILYFIFQYYLKFYKVFESQVWERHKIFTTCKRFLVWYILTILCPTK